MRQIKSMSIAPVDVSSAEIAEGLETIASVPTGGHFFGSAPTLARYGHAFYQPLVSNWQNYENWEIAGQLNATQPATPILQAPPASYGTPPLDPAIDQALEPF